MYQPICLHACVYVHVICMCSCGCIHSVSMSMCVAHMWKPEVNTWYLPQLPSTLFTEIGSPNLELTDSARLAGQKF